MKSFILHTILDLILTFNEESETHHIAFDYSQSSNTLSLFKWVKEERSTLECSIFIHFDDNNEIVRGRFIDVIKNFLK